jgi:hypothetical protein
VQWRTLYAQNTPTQNTPAPNSAQNLTGQKQPINNRASKLQPAQNQAAIARSLFLAGAISSQARLLYDEQTNKRNEIVQRCFV